MEEGVHVCEVGTWHVEVVFKVPQTLFERTVDEV